MAEARNSVIKLNETLDKVKNGNGTLGKLISNDSVYNNLNTLLRNLDSLAVHFNDNPKHFLAPLGKSKRKIERERRREQEEKAKQKQ